MRFDDRLATVLRLRTQGGAVARVQFRQLVDLLGTMPGEANGPTVDAAFNRLVEPLPVKLLSTNAFVTCPPNCAVCQVTELSGCCLAERVLTFNTSLAHSWRSM